MIWQNPSFQLLGPDSGSSFFLSRMGLWVSLWQRCAGFQCLIFVALSSRPPRCETSRESCCRPLRSAGHVQFKQFSSRVLGFWVCVHQEYFSAQTASACLPYSEASCTAYMILLYFSEKGTILKQSRVIGWLVECI